MKFAPIIRYRYFGDQRAAESLRGVGYNLVQVLQNLSSFRNLKQNGITKKFSDDVIIATSHCYNQFTVDIWVRPVLVLEEEESAVTLGSSFLFFAQSYADKSCWGFDTFFNWVFIKDAPVEDDEWLFLGCAKIEGVHTVFAMSFDPFVVWRLEEPYWDIETEEWIDKDAEWVDYKVPTCDYGDPLWATGFTNQPVWTGNESNKFFIRPYISDSTFRDLLSLDIVNKTWDRQAYFQNSGCRVPSTSGYNNTSWPTWDGEKQVAWWHIVDGSPYWTWLYTVVAYYGDLMPHDSQTQSLMKPSRLLTVGGETFFCGDPDFGAAYHGYPIMQKDGEDSYIYVRGGPGFHWGRECCYTGSHILARNPDDYSVWAFNEDGWKEIADAPEYTNEDDELESFEWFDCCYAGGTPRPYAGDIEW